MNRFSVACCMITVAACNGGSSNPAGGDAPDVGSNSDDATPAETDGAIDSPVIDQAHHPIVIIFMEDHAAADIIAKPSVMPYLNSLLAANATSKVFTSYTEGDATGPSLPDYIQTAVGSRCGKRTNTISAGELTGATCGTGTDTSVWNQLETAGVTWTVYMDGMPSPCYDGLLYANTDPAIDTQYSLIGNPAAVFSSVFNNTALCQAHVLPYTSFDPQALPKVTWITPGQCNSQHGVPPTNNTYANCHTDTDEVETRGDTWLHDHVPAMVNAGASVFITYDEGKDGEVGPTLFAVELDKTMTAHQTDGATYSHYSLLRRIEDIYHVSPLGNAATATPLPL